MKEKKSPHTKAYVELLRPGWWPACFFIGVVPGLLAVYLRDGSITNFFRLNTVVWALGYWASVTGIYVLNDWIGVREDAIVNPKRPLPSDRISSRAAFVFSVVMITVGIGLWWAAFSDPLSTVIQGACILLMMIYAAWYKHNFLLGLAAGLIPVGVWVALAPFSWVTVALFLFLFFWELTLDVPENILHFEGDKRYSPGTFAVRFGRERLASVGYVFALLVIGALVWLLFLLEMSILFLIFAALGSVTLLISQLSIRNDISPMKLGRSLGMVMLSMFLINLGFIAHTIVFSYVL